MDALDPLAKESAIHEGWFRGRLEVAAGERLGDEVRLVPRMQLVAKVFDVPLDRPRGDPKLLRALLGRQALSDALQHLTLPLGEGYEVVLLARNVHHEPLFMGKLLMVSSQ
jgi:hypothetical protein